MAQSRRQHARKVKEEVKPASRKVSYQEALSLLQEGEIVSGKLIPWGSNYTFLVELKGAQANGALSCIAVYKPCKGEQLRYDFPPGTLYKREFASYLVSRALGWPRVPPTMIRDGPHGVGSLQLFVECQAGANYFTLRDQTPQELQRIALFDLLANNADRKAGHCLLDSQGNIWSIDHGLTFHHIFKLRTVIWDFSGEPIPKPLLQDLETLLGHLMSTSELSESLSQVLSDQEIAALIHRTQALLEEPGLPPLRSFWKTSLAPGLVAWAQPASHHLRGRSAPASQSNAPGSGFRVSAVERPAERRGGKSLPRLLMNKSTHM